MSTTMAPSQQSPQAPATAGRKRPVGRVVLLTLAGIVAVFLGVAAMQPGDFRVVRSAEMSAPAESAFAQVNDFHNWQAWSPWEKLDPALKRTYSGPEAGEGASYAWAGNSDVGEGRMTIVESRPNELIRIRLEFFKPFAATNTGEFTFEPAGEKTTVTWSMAGERTFVCKGMCLLMDMDKMIGDEFEKGLAAMQAIVEQSAAPESGSR